MWKLHVVTILVAMSGYCEAEWKLTFASEFEGAAGSPPGNQWVFDIGSENTGWGNQERQYYTDNVINAQLDGQGHLKIVATKDGASSKNCWYGPCQYTSARLKTKGTFSQQYGRFEINAKIPSGKGLWPAFWMLGSNFPGTPWPECGEIDIMEVRGSNTNRASGTMHIPGSSGANGITAAYHLPGGQSLSDAYHVFSLEWNPQQIKWFIDGNVYHTVTLANLPNGAPWVNQPSFMLLNLAVGGFFDGDPSPTLTFPQTLYVDYVRVYNQV